VRAVPEAAAVAALGPAPSGGRARRRWIFGSAKHSLPTATVERSRRHRLTLMDRLFLAVIVSALVLLVFSSALLVDRSQSPVMLTERPEKAQGGRPSTSASEIGQIRLRSAVSGNKFPFTERLGFAVGCGDWVRAHTLKTEKCCLAD
jgi:hypothetical protein